MNDIIQNLKADCYSGKDTFCLISENKLNALKELSKREEQEKNNLEQALDEIEKWLKEKAEQMDTFNITQRKETGAFWFNTRGNIDDLLETIKKAKGE